MTSQKRSSRESLRWFSGCSSGRITLLFILATLSVVLAACSTSSGHRPSSSRERSHAAATRTTSTYPVLPVSHVGRWLVDASGRVLLLHGVNVVEKHSPYYPAAFGFNAADAQWLAANGFDMVRLGVMPTGVIPSPGSISEGYLNHLAITVKQLASNHILTLLDVHQDGYGPSVGSDGFPAWMTLTDGATNNHAPFPAYYLSDPAVRQAFQSFWNNQKGPGGKGLQKDYATMIAAVAAKFADTPSILGYDVLNEPWPGTGNAIGCLSPGGCPSLDKSELAPFYARADKAIRSADRTHLVFVEPFVLFNFGDSPTTIPLPGNDPRSGLSFHVYPNPFNIPKVKSVAANAIRWSQKTGGALLNTEWGATSSAKRIAEESSTLDSAMIPWIYWPFMGCSIGCSATATGVIGNLSSPPSGRNLDSAVADALVQPHPLAIAGTPQSFSYNATSHTMNFSWTPARVGGGRYPGGSVTSIQVPRLDYPDGYSAQAIGATVTSKPCSPMLTLSQSGSVDNLSVSITPSNHC